LFENEIVGTEMLERLGGEGFGDRDPVRIEYDIRTQEIIKENDGYVLAIRMPFVEKKEVSLNQKGDELIIRVGNIKRTVTLPRTLLSYSVKGAKFEDEILRIRFGDDNER
jgi:arsenite-transporting ATPase